MEDDRQDASTLLPLSLLLGLFASACGPRYGHIVERELAATDHLGCDGYLVWNRAPVRDVFLVINGSGIGSNAFVHPVVEGLLDSHDVAYATFDKPGIRARFGDPARVRRNDAVFQHYTLGYGIACATEALRWARERFGPTARLHLRGHSEGSLVALYTYDALLDADPNTASAIATLTLSGLALEPFRDILDHQLASMPHGDRVRDAIASCDWSVLEPRLGISCAYIDDANRRPSGRSMFERLAARGTPARFYIFHGMRDWHTSVEPVRALEAWNASTGHLRMEFHYYDGGHSGTDAARAEMSRVLTTIVSQ